MKDKIKRFLFPTEDETFLKDTTLNSNVFNDNLNEQSQPMNVNIPHCTVSDFDDEEENKVEPSVSQNVVFNPLTFNETEEIAREIINGNNVIVNLEDLLKTENGPKVAMRIIDFLCGTSFACKVSVKRINDSTFIFSK